MHNTKYKILDSISDLMVLTDEHGRIIFCNKSSHTFFKTNSSSECIPTEWLPCPEELNTKQVSPKFERLHKIDGERKFVEWSCNEYEDGVFLYLGRDITAHKKREIHLYLAAKDAKSGSNAKMRFLATMSHEIRTPLNGILGMIGLLLDSNLNANQQAYAEAVRESGSALLALINDILDYSKFDAGKMKLEEINFKPTSLVQSVSELLSSQAAHKKLEIATYIDPKLPENFIGDEARLRQVLLNLAGNGVKFTESGGVSIEVYREKVIDENTSQVRIDIRDTGIGIPKDQISTIFDEFAQADSQFTRKFEGTGLGLAIVQKILHSMGGEINVTSTEGVGSLFSVSIPMQHGNQLLPSSKPEQIDHPVLVLTQSEVLQRNISLHIQDIKKPETLITDDVNQAISFLKSNENTTLLCDLDDANKAGEQLTKLAGHSLIMLSPLARGHLDSFKKMGFDGYLIKPIRRSSLLERLTRCAFVRQPSDRLDTKPANNAMPIKKLRVLLAEDNQINSVLATAIVGRAGHHIDVAGNGIEAINALKAAPYDIVLMDMHMPEMDGLTAAENIRNLPDAFSQIPIIALTANSQETDRQACLDVGMNDFITKPFNANELIALIEKWTTEQLQHTA